MSDSMPMLEIDFGADAPKWELKWYFVVVPLESLAERRVLGFCKQYAVATHAEALRMWNEDGPAVEWFADFCGRRRSRVDGYYVARWSEECLNRPTIDWKEMRRMRDEAKWVEARWFDADGNEVATP